MSIYQMSLITTLAFKPNKLFVLEHVMGAFFFWPHVCRGESTGKASTVSSTYFDEICALFHQGSDRPALSVYPPQYINASPIMTRPQLIYPQTKWTTLLLLSLPAGQPSDSVGSLTSQTTRCTCKTTSHTQIARPSIPRSESSRLPDR